MTMASTSLMGVPPVPPPLPQAPPRTRRPSSRCRSRTWGWWSGAPAAPGCCGNLSARAATPSTPKVCPSLVPFAPPRHSSGQSRRPWLHRQLSGCIFYSQPASFTFGPPVIAPPLRPSPLARRSPGPRGQGRPPAPPRGRRRRLHRDRRREPLPVRHPRPRGSHPPTS